MTRHVGLLAGAFTALLASASCGEARAQYGAGTAGTRSTNIVMFANPGMNPNVNPTPNRRAERSEMSPGDAARLSFSSQVAMGGVGPSPNRGVRPVPRMQAQRPGGPKPPEVDRHVPGVPASVARYFQRGPEKPVTPAAANRQGRW